MDPTLLIFNTPAEAAQSCGDRTLEILARAREDRGFAMLAVSGGSTPRLMFESMTKRSFDWTAVHIFQVDERCVPPDHPDSNYRLLRQSLLSGISTDQPEIHRVKGELSPADAAREYADEIARTFRAAGAPSSTVPVFDVIQRGMGPDAHTASLFPGEPLNDDQNGIVAAIDGSRAGMEGDKRYRVTLLRGVLEAARHTLCLATGKEKAAALAKVLTSPFDPVNLPAQIASKDMVWYLDKEAASGLNH